MITQHSHMSSKTTIISNLLQRESSIQPTAEVTATQMPQGVAVNDDGPTMLELMMAAQEQARNTKTLESKELGNSFGGGFKKGFLGKSPAISKAAKSIETKQKPKCTDISQQTSVGEIIDVTATITLEKRDQSRHHAPVLDEVQEAMAEDDNPFLAKLKKGGKCHFYAKGRPSYATKLFPYSLLKYRLGEREIATPSGIKQGSGDRSA